MKSNKRLCITAFVYGWYRHFIPIYIYSILRSYPHYFVKVFLFNRLDPHNRELLGLVRQYGYDRYEIVENYFQDIFDRNRRYLRFFIPRREFADFDYVYFGDVDFIICKEQPGILEAHAAHCKAIGLPYSNVVRRGDWKDLGLRRLTGLHFVCAPEYYSKVEPLIQRYKDHERLGYRIIMLLYSVVGRRRDFDELVLYDLMKKAFGEPPDVIVSGRQAYSHFRPHHGIHLGYLRGRGKLPPHRKVEWAGFWDQIEGDEGLDFLFENSDVRLVNMFRELRTIMRER